jgi:hypothetical protein
MILKAVKHCSIDKILKSNRKLAALLFFRLTTPIRTNRYPSLADENMRLPVGYFTKRFVIPRQAIGGRKRKTVCGMQCLSSDESLGDTQLRGG